MSFYIDETRNNGYPYIKDIPEMPSADMKKPYHRYFFTLDKNKNNGYPSFEALGNMQGFVMQKPYPHGLMICMGDDVNDGYPCIPELNNIGLEKSSLIYFGEKHIEEMYYGHIYISEAYCNEKEVFRIRYTIV